MKCFRIIYSLKIAQLLGLNRHLLGKVRWLRLDLHALRVWVSGNQLLLRVDNVHVIGQRHLWSSLAGHIVIQHDLHLDAEHALTKQHMADSHIDVIVLWLTRVNHPAIDELHALGTLATKLAADDHLASLGARLHDETQHTIASTTHGQATDQLVTQRLALGDSAQTTVRNLQSKQLKK